MMLLIFALLGAPEPAQTQNVEFRFQDAPADAVFQFVQRETGLMVINRSNFHGNVTAYGDVERTGDAEQDTTRIVAFLDSAVRGSQQAVLRIGDFIVVMTEEQARREAPDIVVVESPDSVEPTEQVKTFVIPLRHLAVTEAERELRDLFPQGAQIAVNSHSNSFVITDSGIRVLRIVSILSILDVHAGEDLAIEVFPLENADAEQMVDLINNLILNTKEEEQNQDQQGWGQLIRMFRGGGGDEQQQRSSPAGSVVRVAADVRTNSVVVAAAEENMQPIRDLITRLDNETPEAGMIEIFFLRFADATEAADLIEEVFAEPSGSSDEPSQGGRGRNMWWMQMMQQEEPVQSGLTVSAVADGRTNSIIVTAGENQMVQVRQLVGELDRQISDLLVLRVYVLRNANASDMANQIRDLLEPTSASTQANANQQVPRWMQGFMAQQQEAASVSRFAQLEVVADTRTNSVIVKATQEYIEVVDQLVAELDNNPSESTQTVILPVRYGNAVEYAETLRELLGQGPSRRSQQWQTQQQQNGQGGNFGSYFQGQGGQGGGGRNSGGGNQGGMGGFNFPQMSQDQDPTQDPGLQDPTQQPPQEAVPPATGLQGTVDIVPDPDTNTILIRGSPRNLEGIRSLMVELDRPRPQVMIRVLIADVTLDDAMSLGVEATWRSATSLGDMELTTDFEDLNQNNVGQGQFAFSVTGDHIEATLTALARQGRAEILATPQILVLSNQAAQIVIGSEVPLIESSRIDQATGATINTIRYEQIGIILNVTPTINPDGLVRMIVAPEVSDLDTTRQVPISSNASAPTISTNSASTTVTVRHGQTVVIGGLIREQDESIRQGIPFLMDIPILGVLFSKQDTVERRRELMMFVTPYVVHTQPELEELTALERARLRLIDERDIQTETQRWDRFIAD